MIVLSKFISAKANLFISDRFVEVSFCRISFASGPCMAIWAKASVISLIATSYEVACFSSHAITFSLFIALAQRRIEASGFLYNRRSSIIPPFSSQRSVYWL
jgi:hypothetical protein